MEENELQTSDAQSAPSSEEQPVQNEPAQQGTQAEPAQESKQESQVPFHEHPRFKELVEQKNRYAEEAKSTAQRLAELEKRLSSQSQPKPQENPLLSRLKGIDPEFGDFMEKMYHDAQKVRELESWKAQKEGEELRTRAIGEMRKLHDEHKVPANLRDLYQSQIELAAMRDPNLGLKDLPGLYKQVHDTYSKLLDEAKRAERESYVSAKKTDSKVPTSQPKGTTVKPGKPEAKSDPYTRKQNMVKDILDSVRKERTELGSH